MILFRAILDGGDGETRVDSQIGEAVRITAEILRLLGGRATSQDVTHDWLKRNAFELPKITLANAVEQLKKRAKTDGKSAAGVREYRQWLSGTRR